MRAALEDHLLEHLSIVQLGTLRGTCKDWRDFVDAAPPGAVLPAARHILPAAVLPSLKTCLDLQAAARQQGHIFRNIHAGSTHVLALPNSPASLQRCTEWSGWSPLHGHQWLIASSCSRNNESSSAFSGQMPSTTASRSRAQTASAATDTRPMYQLIDIKKCQAEKLPKELGASHGDGFQFAASWTAWVGKARDHVLVCQSDGSLHVFKPGSTTCYSRWQDGSMLHTFPAKDILAPAGSALLWPCIVSGQHRILVTNLPDLTERHQASWLVTSLTPQGMLMSPDWIAWSPCGLLYSVAWRPGTGDKDANIDLGAPWRPRWRDIDGEFQLLFYAASDGSIHGKKLSHWGEYRHKSEYQWMERGDCVIILLHRKERNGRGYVKFHEAANVISSTGKKIDGILSDAYSRHEYLSPDGEYVFLHEDDSRGGVHEGPSKSCLLHARSCTIVSTVNDFADHAAHHNIWSQDGKFCHHLAVKDGHGWKEYADSHKVFRQILHLQGWRAAPESVCHYPAGIEPKTQIGGGRIGNRFSPGGSQPVFVEAVRQQQTDELNASWQLAHWECHHPGEDAAMKIVPLSSSLSLSRPGAIHENDLAWHPNQHLKVYAVLVGQESLHLICTATHAQLRSLCVRQLFRRAHACMLPATAALSPSSLAWSPDGSQLFVAYKQAAGAIVIDFG